MIKNAQQTHTAFDCRPIGVFDSGVGGISIAKCMQQQLPHEHLIYFADSQYAPYGEKSVDFIQQRVNTIASTLVAHQVKALVLACNTATVNAIGQLRQRYDMPIIGVEPAIKPAVMLSNSKKIALLVTQATASSMHFLSLVQRFSLGAHVYIQACPGVVELIEQGQHQSRQCTELLKRYISPLLEQGVDTLVLGCTHYPLLTDSISKLVGPGINLVEPAVAVVQQLQRQLTAQQINASTTQKGQIRFLSSGNQPSQDRLFSELWQQSVLIESWS